ncbi:MULTISPECIES: hypothetical protein [unclassified Pseudomonas]|uniref:hypothetical protein n=1 Tax=unclassified Pseudomonas TaxID=196821 RepID=UPI000D855061|nr:MULTISPECIES: hypothetical protein [unclassified Pseudomonas]PYG83199.1 hypothetical protein N428_00490 [Pseudomonas sp. RV120224-01c]PYG86395.1 hypothetical protein N436_00489 [Pseudomonas sp. RV120224-01b]
MQPFQYALSAGIVLLFVLAVLPYLFAAARRRAHEEGKEIGLAEHNATHAQRLRMLNEELAELAVQREADQRKHLKTVANLKLTISELEERIMSYTCMPVTRADYELLTKVGETLQLAHRTMKALKSDQQASRAAAQALCVDSLAKRIHAQLRGTLATASTAEAAA